MKMEYLYHRELDLRSIRVNLVASLILYTMLSCCQCLPSWERAGAQIPNHHIFTCQDPKQKVGMVEEGVLIYLSLLREKYFHGTHEGTESYLFTSSWQEQGHTATPAPKGVWKMSCF